MVEHGFVQIVLLMLIAVVSVALFKRIHLPPILAYLFAGIIAGPSGFALYSHPEDMHLAAEVGIVFLLFSLGFPTVFAHVCATLLSTFRFCFLFHPSSTFASRTCGT